MSHCTPHSEESKRKMSLALTGKKSKRVYTPLSEEQKKKMSLTKTQDINKRFWEKVDITDFFECWNWLANKNRRGYGDFRYLKGHISAPRMAWILTKGNIPNGMYVCHHCDNPSCCNPAHLFLGTPQNNVQDMVNKGRQRKGESQVNAKLTGKEVLEIRELAKNGQFQYEIAKLYGISQRLVWNIIHRKAWKHL